MPKGVQGPTGLWKTTGKIGQIFGNPPDSTGPVLFSKLRHFMDAQTLDIKEGPKDGNLMERYYYPSWAAKYWLNRYLKVTKQRDRLPKMDNVERLAIIHVRLSAKSGIGRKMDENTLRYVASSIAKSNTLVSAWNKLNPSSRESSKRFSHILLYGDFDYFGGLELKRLVEVVIDDPDVKVLFISRLWESGEITGETPRTQRGMISAERREQGRIDNEVRELWSSFRSTGWDGIPVQVKILGIWTTLCKRYNPRACVIGHRSGFIEAAGLLGLPTLYLNDERQKIDRARAKKPGELLWAPFQDTNRLRMLSDVMNTIIPVEVLKEHPKNKEGNNQEIDTLKIATGYEAELTAALFMFMCCNIDTSRGKRYGSSPAWTARTALRNSESGQEWLRERYSFAVGKSQGQGGTVWNDNGFLPWLNDIGEIWDYEWRLRRLGLLAYDLGNNTN
ncbi:hypothetical protein IL306_009821 [Fusarium sp. DS 682]|nr:hypothetical protein IL306_009821 [Fusarium sp. DS 682]